jgi:16S rRNA (cytidine1402-2'-O)-methyltransferase
LSALAERYAAQPPKGEIVIVVAPPGAAPPATKADTDAALAEALSRLSPARAAGEVAKKFNVDRRDLYTRAMAMQGK